MPQIIVGKIQKKYFFQKSKYTHYSTINLKGKASDSKNIVTALVYFCSYPNGTSCITRSFLIRRKVPEGYRREELEEELDILFINIYGAYYCLEKMIGAMLTNDESALFFQLRQ